MNYALLIAGSLFVILLFEHPTPRRLQNTSQDEDKLTNSYERSELINNY